MDKVAPFSALEPAAIIFSKDFSRYYVACQNTSEIRVYLSATDSLISAIEVGPQPSVMSISNKHNYLFVSCQEDSLSFPSKRGTIAVIDISENKLITKVHTGHQPRGIAADDRNGLVYIAHRNSSDGGPEPHHSFDISSCSGRNGYVTFLEMDTFELLKVGDSNSPLKIELAVDPYVLALRK